MKIYIVFKGYWLYQAEIDSIYDNEKEAIKRKQEILKSDTNSRSYIKTYEIQLTKK